MNFDDYTKVVLPLRLPTASVEYVRLSLAGETGELLGYFGKTIRDEFVIDRQHVKKELGDILWNLAACAADNGLTLQEVAQGNVEKLTDRAKRGVLGGSGDNR